MGEIETRLNNILVGTMMILQRKDPEQTKRLRELWVAWGIEIDRWNMETYKIMTEANIYK